ncbi:hypothetical protein MTR_6g080610 [Medicago truncatula]|uniref:Transmembrane protein n=1 Tax=Medicago truncatula TaxID=3880 RepID=G7KLN2_MEDTR|nr:hypothetical protein MTR_6g080610 [Medicago truncatula]
MGCLPFLIWGYLLVCVAGEAWKWCMLLPWEEEQVRELYELLNPIGVHANKDTAPSREYLETKVNQIEAMVKFHLKKVLCMGVANGNVFSRFATNCYDES